MTETVLVVNAGSSSIEFQLISVAAGDQLERRLKGRIEGVGVKRHLIARGFKGENLIDETRASSDQETSEFRDFCVALSGWLPRALEDESRKLSQASILIVTKNSSRPYAVSLSRSLAHTL